METNVNQSAQKESVENSVFLSPSTDIVENQNEIIIISEMPGVNENAVNVSFENNIISLTGSMRLPNFSDEFKDVRKEIEEGVYERSFSILSEINVDHISAKIKDGILRVILPKSEKVKPKKIEVKVE